MFSLVMRTLRISQLSYIMYSNANYIYPVVYYIASTYLSYN